jgi:hypothetical protein
MYILKMQVFLDHPIPVRTAPGESVFLGIERGETIKHRDRGERSLGLGLASWLVVRSLPDCEGGGKGVSLSGEERLWRRRGSEEGEAGRRVQEVQTQTPRSGFTDPKRRSAESDSTPGFRRPPWARGSPRGTSGSPNTSTAP